MNNIELTEDQKKQIEREFKKNPDLKNITQAVFGDEDLDGRSKEGRAVRAFLIRSELTFTTTLWNFCVGIDQKLLMTMIC